MTYYYNENERVFAIYTNFVPNKKPKGYKEITKEEYDRLQEELQQESQNENDEIPKVEYSE